MTDASLLGKVALVTGGSRGLGAATAERLASLGADVAIGYATRSDLAQSVVGRVRAFGVRAEAYAADLRDPKQPEELAGRVAAAFGQIDILVNSAGVVLLGDLDAADRAKVFAVNVEGLVAVTKATTQFMPDGGRIISISSTAENRSSFAGISDYAASKAAIASYSRSWAHDLAPRRINVNAVEVSLAETENMGIPPDTETGQQLIQRIPLRRYGRADEVAAAVAFLAGPDATYITGTSLRVDGGWSA